MMNSNLPSAYEFFCQIKRDLKTKNRFSVDERLNTLIDLYAKEKYNEDLLPEGKTLYRARIYKDDDAESKFYSPPAKTRFKGYDPSNSFVNENYEYISEGRCNPQYIPYLYAANSEDCCIHEVRPAKDAYVNVAKIKVKENLRILKLEKRNGFVTNTRNTIIDDVRDVTLFLYLAFEFSRPHKEFGDYLFCQYVSEKIKSLGFDGIAYESAVYSGKRNTNYVIFNYNKCKPTSSYLKFISNVSIEALSLKEMTNK